jgi:pyridoxal biosynthesis lyase PdxS
MAKARIGHFVEAQVSYVHGISSHLTKLKQILQAVGCDYIDESEVCTIKLHAPKIEMHINDPLPS